MTFDIVMITAGSRPRLLEQSLRSLRENASNWNQHSLTVVLDHYTTDGTCLTGRIIPDDRLIINTQCQGASRSRNIGASSTLKHLRKDAVMFLDDDVYCCDRWDTRIGGPLNNSKKVRPTSPAISGHAHPYNHTIIGDMSHYGYQLTTVLSTVNIVCRWFMWDDVGFFAEPGGPGGSEDVDWCKRATNYSYDLAVTVPQCIIHTGIGSTSGKKLIGWEHVMENNRKLEKFYGIEGRVLYE